jgi:hypothetical protein
VSILRRLTEDDGRWPIPLTEVEPAQPGDAVALAEVFEICQGATPGGSGEFDMKPVVVMDRAQARAAGIERQVLVPAVGGRDVAGDLLPVPKQVALYPYARNGQLVDLGADIDAPTDQDARRRLNRLIAQGRIRFPEAARYLVAHYGRLRNREFEGQTVAARRQPWYKWHRPRDPGLLLHRPKIVVRRQFRTDVAAVDRHGALPLDSVWALVPKMADDAWRHFFERVQAAAGRRISEEEVLVAVARIISRRLRERLGNADTPLQGQYLSARARDLAQLIVAIGEVVAELSPGVHA